MKTKVSYGRCEIQVIGTNLTCPFCKVLVQSGERHECYPMEVTAERIQPKKGK